MKLGCYNTLKVLRFTSVGIFLGDDLGNEILLPNKYVPEHISVDDEINVFIYKDSEDRPIATTLTPMIKLGEFASLRVKEVSTVGAFLDWGLEKDLLVPFNEQKTQLQEGYWYLVYLYYDDRSDRLVATTKLDAHFNKDLSALHDGQEVDLLIGERSDLGFTAIINNGYKGLLYHNELFTDLRQGMKITGYIKHIRPDGKIDLTLNQSGYRTIEPNAQVILNLLREKQGFLGLTDNSDPEEIYHLLQMSKKSFKKAVGSLYKQNLITLTDKGIQLV